ncbi:MAG: hypothetical protein FWD64_12470, partial [Acidobacteriaceae bacterium]|nr:hypothetical protein [Acidobacteriaceae bacterium]
MSWFTAKTFAQVATVADRAAASDNNVVAEQISAPGLRIGLSKDGHVLEAKLGPEQVSVPLRMCTFLQNCTVDPEGSYRKLEGGGVEFIHRWTRLDSGERCQVTDRLVPTETSIRWEIEVLGEDEPWSTGIETQLAWLKGREARLWTAWSRPVEDVNRWADPLTFTRFTNRTLRYGAHGQPVDYLTVGGHGMYEGEHSFAVPMVTVGEPGRDIALSVIQSPDDTLLDMELRTTEMGDAVLARMNHRISSASPVRFAIDLVAHPADWRAGLGWMAARYPRYFEPINHRAYELDGCGAYSGYHGELDVQTLAQMAMSVNWNATFGWPFLGMNIPLVDPDVEWNSWYQKPTSIARMSDYNRKMREKGFHVLEYFVTTEAGNYIQDAAPPRKAASASELWRDPNDFIYYAVQDAVLRNEDGSIHFSNWFKNVVMDPGEPVWQRYLVEQAKHMVATLPYSDGIAIDRMDWLMLYNARRDDKVSWVNGRAARSLVSSWKEALARMAPVFHDANKFVFVNCLTRRVDTLGHVDGIFMEFGDSPSALNLAGVMGSQCPVTVWTDGIDSLRPDPDAFFQQRLHLGVFPLAPFPDSDHSIAPDPWINAQYLDYGGMLNAIRGKRWVLKANAVSCAGEKAKVNLFDIP